MPYLTLNVPANSEFKSPGPELLLGISTEQMGSTTIKPLVTTINAIGSDVAADGRVMTEYPLVELDTEMITDATAARLATSLLGHVLFLKNQVPLPVAQLARFPNAKTNPRSLKQRQDLLNSYDTISSHLETTFSALSTAFARSRSCGDSPLAQAYLAFLVGPGIRTAKAKVILGIDGLEKRIWGSRDDTRPPDISDGTDTEGDSEGDEESDEGAEEPDDSEEEETDEEDSATTDNPHDEAESSPHDLVDPALYVSRVEEKKFLQNSDRLLSRVLANADANGKGMISEIAPTQTHILIRAPRHFAHPAWIPCQNTSAFLDGILDEFLRGSGQSEVSNSSIQKPNKGPKVEGVWVTTRMGIQKPPRPESSLQTSTKDEEEDLIWWSWDGKFLGFADW